MKHDEVTEQILGAWDDVVAEQQEPVEEPVSEEEEVVADPDEEGEAESEDDVEEEPAEEEEEPAAEPEEGEPEDEEAEESEEDEEPVVAYESDDIEVKAFLAKYGGDLDKALKGAAELSHLVGRQGQEKNALSQRVEELESELTRARAFSTGGVPLSEEQREWIEEAVQSGNAAAYVQRAVDEGEFDLARAVCQEWAREDPYNANRVGSQVDQIEQQITSYVPPIDMSRMLDAIRNQYPDMPAYEGQMVQVLQQLGDDHHLVRDARSNDINAVARGIVGIYELARASSVSVRAAKEKVKAEQRQNGASARKKAVVQSGSASPSVSETPRAVRLGPGLTLEQLEAEFAAQTRQ